jgi:MoxR-like ATPase
MTIRPAVDQIIGNIERVIVGKRAQIEYLLVAALCGGHVLIDDVPGTGKTMLARSFAASLGVGFRRLQCTPDLLPNDITGVRVFDPRSAEFRFEPGPVFTNVLLADEINRATPRSQSALLEAMAERQVTVDGDTRSLPSPFLVLATQNPIEFEGTFPLPEAQLDRFMVSIGLGYPTKEEEAGLIDTIGLDHPVEALGPVTDAAAWKAAAKEAATTHLDPRLSRYIVEVVGATRSHHALELGGSTRATLALAAATRAFAAMKGRDYALPDDVKALAGPVLAHRLVMSPEGRLRGLRPRGVIDEILTSIPTGSTV